MKFFGLLFLFCSAITAFGQSKVEITNLVEQQKLGKEFVRELLSLQPETNSSMRGILKIRNPNGKSTQLPLRVEVSRTWIAELGSHNWKINYEIARSNQASLTIAHLQNQANVYFVGTNDVHQTISGNETMAPFAESDFWIADLGLEFLYWPEQRMISKEMKSIGGIGISCKVIESINPKPAPNTYSKVRSWIRFEGAEAGAPPMVYAEAFDAKGKLLKEFKPKQIEKINGDYKLREMEMLNVQTGSRTRIEFNLEN
jgi:hypothetical protein